MPTNTVIKLTLETDAERMLAIYTPIIRETAISFELEPPTVAEFQLRVSNTLRQTPWLVCEEDGKILGYAYAGSYRARAAYQWSVEATVYVGAAWRGRGVGRALYTALCRCLRVQGYHNAFAAIALPNDASVKLHEKLGFKPIGVYRSVGYKLGQWHDVGWWQLALQGFSASPTPPRPLPEVVTTPEWREAFQKGTETL